MSAETQSLLAQKLPKNFTRAYFHATDKVVFLNKKTQVAQFDYPGEKLENERPRTSKAPLAKPMKDIPQLFVIEPQPDSMPEGWEQCVAVIATKKGDFEDPHLLYRNIKEHTIQEADPRPNDAEMELPEGWTNETDPDGDAFFFDHNTNFATYDDPRLVDQPQPAENLTDFVQKRIAARPRTSMFKVSKEGSAKVKAWSIGARDVKKFEGIDNHLASVSEIPAPVRNKTHNRYMDILPNPKTRVPLSEQPGDPTSTYVNANYVRGYNGDPKHYIAAMGPLPGSINNFWRMIWESNASTIVMATGLIEKGKRKCERYWPAKVDGATTMSFGDIDVVSVKEVPAKGYVYTMLKATRGGESRRVDHFWYNTWPDHGVPKTADNTLYPDSVLGLLHTVHKLADKQKGRPVVVHCSAGIGRTGTIIAIDHARQHLKEKHHVDVLEVISQLRHDRCALVQHPQQFEFVHEACVKYAELHKAHFTVEESTAPPVAPRPRTSGSTTEGRKVEKAAAFKRAQESKRRGGRRSIMSRAQINGELRLKGKYDADSADADEMWRVLDLDNDGTISMREARMNGMDPITFAEIDTNGDGVLTMQEFKDYYKKKFAA